MKENLVHAQIYYVQILSFKFHLVVNVPDQVHYQSFVFMKFATPQKELLLDFLELVL